MYHDCSLLSIELPLFYSLLRPTCLPVRWNACKLRVDMEKMKPLQSVHRSLISSENVKMNVRTRTLFYPANIHINIKIQTKRNHSNHKIVSHPRPWFMPQDTQTSLPLPFLFNIQITCKTVYYHAIIFLLAHTQTKLILPLVVHKCQTLLSWRTQEKNITTQYWYTQRSDIKEKNPLMNK